MTPVAVEMDWRDEVAVRDSLGAFGRQALTAFAQRAAKRVAIFLELRQWNTTLVSAGFVVESHEWSVRPHFADYYASRAAMGEADAPELVAELIAKSYDAAGAGPAHAADDFRRAAASDYERFVSLASDTSAPPLTGWDDPRLGPLWPDGAPEWHQQLEREVAEMRAKLAARPDPFAPPIPDETRRKLDDHRKLNELGDQGAFKDCRGQYVFVYNGEFVGHGAELGEARRQAAEKLGVPPSSLVYRYVY
jgi:hypothetical protein